jgi:hypothetical protein
MNAVRPRSIAAVVLPLLALLQSACSMALEERPHPTVALAIGTAAAPLCSVTSAAFAAQGKPARPYPPDGSAAVADGERLEVVFNSRGPTGRQCVAVDLSTMGQSIATSAAERDACARLGKVQSPVIATSDAETMLAWDAARGDRSNLFIGVVVYDLPPAGRPGRSHAHVVAHAFGLPPGGLEGSPSDPALADIGDERFFLSWTQGNDESAQLRAQAVAAWGEAIGPALQLSPSDSTVIGASSAAFTRDGSGVVTYFASTDSTIELMATRVSCSRSPTTAGDTMVARAR